MTSGSLVLGFLAGLLSTLSPCVLPLLPLVFSSAVAAHPFGILALGAGVVASFVAVGLFVATIGFSIGLDGDVFRLIAAAMMVAIGAVLLSSQAQAWLAVAAGRAGNAGDGLLRRMSPETRLPGWIGQLAIGLLLGAIWSPCVGPTLGAASLLAAQGQDLWAVASVMTAFAAGAALPLVLVGGLSRQALSRWRGRLALAGQGGKYLLGAVLVCVGLAILTGYDHRIETWAVNASPEWLSDLTTRF